MADEIARNQQYEYRQNSNLVLQVDYTLTDRRGHDEATGEVMPLTQGHLSGLKMGDRAQRTKAPVADKEKKAKKKKPHEDKILKSAKGSLLNDTQELMGLYKPRTQETKQTYEVILAFIQEALGDQPRDILCGAADEVLSVLKSEKVRDKDKKKEVEALLDNLADERYAVLVNLSRKITDFSLEEEQYEADVIDENEGVNVHFEESDDEKDDMMDEIKPDDDHSGSDDDLGQEAEYSETLKAQGGLPDEIEEAQRRNQLHARDIDAHWIQRSLAKYFKDPIVAQEKVKEVISILKKAANDRDCENQLVLLLGFETFEFIRVLRTHRQLVLWCTLLKKANEDEKIALKAEMNADPNLHYILSQLEETEGSDLVESEREKRAKASIKRSDDAAGEEAVSAGAWMHQRKELKLEEYTFAQGSHLMSNKNCQMPPGSYRRNHKSYEEVCIPALKTKPLDPGEKLKAISDLPEFARKAFAGYTSLNRIQSKLCKSALQTDEHLLLWSW